MLALEHRREKQITWQFYPHYTEYKQSKTIEPFSTKKLSRLIILLLKMLPHSVTKDCHFHFHIRVIYFGTFSVHITLLYMLDVGIQVIKKYNIFVNFNHLQLIIKLFRTNKVTFKTVS